MTIKDATVYAYGEETGIGTNGVLEIDGSTVGAMADSSAYDGTVRGVYASGLNIEDSSVEVISKSLSGGAAADGRYVAGIEVDGGTGTSINIANSKVKASAISTRSGDSLTGIANLAEGGTIYVDDTALTVYVSGSEDLEDGVGIYVSDGDLAVSDSDLSVTALGCAARGVSAQVVDSAGVKAAPEVTFANSNVSIEAAGPAVTSIYYGSESQQASLERMGKVVLVNSVISLGGQVQDILFELGEDGADVWAVGQSIGDDADLASKVTIEALGDGSGADVPAVSDGSGADVPTAGSDGISQTGDDAASFGIMAAFAAIAAAFAGFIAATRRRFDNAAK